MNLTRCDRLRGSVAGPIGSGGTGAFYFVGVTTFDHVRECLSKKQAQVQAGFWPDTKSVLALPPPAASGPCLGVPALVGVRGRPLLFLLFPPVFPVLVRCARWGQTAKAKANRWHGWLKPLRSV